MKPEMLVEVRSTDMRVQTTKKGNKLFWQKVGYSDGNDFPIVFNVFRGSPDDHGNEPQALKPGKYLFKPSFTAGQYGDLQIQAFDCKIEPVAAAATSKAS